VKRAAVLGALAVAGCGQAATPSSPPPQPAAAATTTTTTTTTAARPTARTPTAGTPTARKVAPAHHAHKRRPRRVAPLPPPVPDPRPASAQSGVSPGAPSDAQVRRELARALHLRPGATARQLVDAAELTASGLAVTPPAAPDAVDAVIRAGNRVAHAPYVYGGGHATWIDSAYDCSGSVSFALANAGLVRRQLDSTQFEHWGLPGPGRWITVYANAVHAWMIVAGLRFDTSGRAGPHGSRWQAAARGTAGFAVRHPAGL
jgi:cell wall-associated NlpC family hydrolase